MCRGCRGVFLCKCSAENRRKIQRQYAPLGWFFFFLFLYLVLTYR